MFKITRKTPESPASAEARSTILTEINNEVASGDSSKSKELAEIYKILVEADTPAEKQGMSDHVKVAMISAGASLIGILAVIRHEEVNVVASKALGFIVKPKI